MCGIASEYIFRNAHIIGGESKPGVIVPSGPCNDTGTYRLYNK